MASVETYLNHEIQWRETGERFVALVRPSEGTGLPAVICATVVEGMAGLKAKTYEIIDNGMLETFRPVIHVKVMTDYHCPPLWWDTGSDQVGPIDPEELSLSRPLVAELWAWARTFDDILVADDPVASAFPSLDDEKAFETRGRELTGRVQRELGPSAVVRYWRDG